MSNLFSSAEIAFSMTKITLYIPYYTVIKKAKHINLIDIPSKMPTANEMKENLLAMTKKAIGSSLDEIVLPKFVLREYIRIPEEQRQTYLELLRDFVEESLKNPFMGSAIVGFTNNLATVLVNAPTLGRSYYETMVEITRKKTEMGEGSQLVEQLNLLPEEQREYYLKTIGSIAKHGGGDVVQVMAYSFAELLIKAPELRGIYSELMLDIVFHYKEVNGRMMATKLCEMLQTYTPDSVKKFVCEGHMVGRKAVDEFYKQADGPNPPILVKK